MLKGCGRNSANGISRTKGNESTANKLTKRTKGPENMDSLVIPWESNANPKTLSHNPSKFIMRR